GGENDGQPAGIRAREIPHERTHSETATPHPRPSGHHEFFLLFPADVGAPASEGAEPCGGASRASEASPTNRPTRKRRATANAGTSPAAVAMAPSFISPSSGPIGNIDTATKTPNTRLGVVASAVTTASFHPMPRGRWRPESVASPSATRIPSGR